MSTMSNAVPISAMMDIAASYAECLRTMNAAALRGVRFDMDTCLQPVVNLPSESLELLIGMAQDFNRQECLERCTRNREEGVKYGRPNKALPDNFLVEAQRWIAGELSSVKAAHNCGMPPSTFRLRAKKAGLKQNKGDNAQQGVSIHG